MAAVAGLAWMPVFYGREVVPLVAGAAVLAAALSALLGARPLWQSLTLTCAAWLAAAAALLFRDAGPEAPAAAALALGAAPKAALAIIPPLPDRPDLLVLPAALTWFAAFAAAELGQRTRSPLLPALPPALAFAVALVLGAGGSAVPVAALLAGLAALTALVRAPAPRPRLGPALALATALAAAVAGPNLPVLAARAPFDARPLVAPAAAAAPAGFDPLDEVSAWLSRPDEPLFTVRARSPEDWRLVTLDRFDGVRWSTGATFVPSGGRVPAGRTSAPAGAVEQQVAIQGLDGSWLPAADRPTSVTGAAIAVDPGSGTILAMSSLRPGLRYRAESAVPRLALGALAAAAVAADPGDVALPAGPQPAELRRLALDATAGSESPFQAAVLLAAWLRDNEVFDAGAAPGHSYRAVEFFLLTSHRGTSEQFATAFALMARAIGLPARVAVGFRPGRFVNGLWQVRSGDVLAWPEVEFAGQGWVPFFPTPDPAGPASGGAQVPAGETAARQSIDRQVAAAPARPTPRPARTRPVAPAARPAPAPWIAAGGAGAAALAVLVRATLPAWRRRRRRRRRTPAGRVAGAWAEALDGLRRAGVRPGDALSAHDVAALGAAARGEAAGRLLRSLAGAANHAGFAPEPPAPADADAAWRDCDALRRLLR